MSFEYRPAKSYTDRRGLFVGLSGGTNSGKSYSALRLARGIAGPTGKIAVLDTEGGRTLHLAMDFEFDCVVMDPPFRPERFAEAARDAEAAGYACLLIDSFSMEWSGMGGVLDWQAEEFERMGSREEIKLASWIKPKVGHKAMVYSFLQRRMPIVFALRGEEKTEKKGSKVVKRWAPICNKGFPFELTVSFMLQADRKGVVDLSDPLTFKMEGDHRGIFRDGDQISESHGAALAAWANGKAAAVAVDPFHDARDAAARGMKALEAWWAGVGRPHQRALKDRLAELKAIANAADEAGADGSEPEDPFAVTQLREPLPVQAEAPPVDPAAEEDPFGLPPIKAEASVPASDIDDDWALVPPEQWPDHVYRLCGDLANIASGPALDVALASPKFAAYAAMAKHAPQSRKVMDAEIAKRRKELAA